MAEPITARTIVETYAQKLGLTWLAGRAGAGRVVGGEDTPAVNESLVGYLNLVRPPRIQVLGEAELDYLGNLGKNSYDDTVTNLFARAPAMVIVAQGMPVPDALQKAAQATGTPLLSTRLSGHKLISYLQHHFSQLFADKITLHGVFMEVMGIGVLLSGPSAVGKSELALELMSRGHRLIADDAPEFARAAPDTLAGTCPEPLQGFLEVRGLGVLNIRAMYGDNALKTSKYLRLIIRLEQLSDEDLSKLDRLQGSRRIRNILDVEVPEILLPVAPGRNLAVIVEAAVRNHVLLHSGYNAGEDFILRQKQFIEQQQQ